RRLDRCRKPRSARHRPGPRVGAWPSMSAFTALLARDLSPGVRGGGGALIGAFFFLIVVTLLPFAVGPDLALLQRIGPAILWLGALLAGPLPLCGLPPADPT